MRKALLISLLLYLFFTFPIYAIRSLPYGVQPKPIEGEAIGTFFEQRASGTISFVNTGGEARLVTVCGDMTGTGANSVTCTGIDVEGTFTGGPNGVALFQSSSGEIKLQLNDGKVFSFSSSGISMDFTVTDPSIFDYWVEDNGNRDSGARVSDLSGQVEIACPPDLEAWDVMKMGRVIYVDCHLKTGEDSKAVISFSDMTTFEMKPETEVVIDTPPEKDSKLSLLMGNIWVNVKQMVKDGTMKVHMSQAVAGIKGTKFILTETGTESRIDVTEGVVDFQSKANNKSILVSAGESVTATKTGLSDKESIGTASGQEIRKENNSPVKQASLDMIFSSMKITLLIGGGVIVLILVVVTMLLIKNNRTKAVS